MSVTLNDIAERTGFSVRTVSCVLNNKKDRISEQTSEKIKACARRLRYRPNASARAIQAGRFNHVGLLLSQTESS
ncbi:MAG: LacI family DNA-binding transcriptional regulator, partial [Planctomycetota bacterium]|nr:LacI family DNA-binding transcriptional regulator [Planctomycetota bacterium]